MEPDALPDGNRRCLRFQVPTNTSTGCTPPVLTPKAAAIQARRMCVRLPLPGGKPSPRVGRGGAIERMVMPPPPPEAGSGAEMAEALRVYGDDPACGMVVRTVQP